MSATADQDVTVDGTGEYIYEHTEHTVEPGTAMIVRCQSGATQAALVNVEGLHAADEFDRIAKGSSQVYTIAGRGLRKVYAKGEGGNTTIDYAIIEG